MEERLPIDLRVPSFALKAEQNSIIISWVEIPQIDGYIIESYNSKLKEYEVICDTCSSVITSYYYNALEYGKTYQIRMRTYIYLEGGSRIYGEYSKSKTITTKPPIPYLKVEVKKKKICLDWTKAVPSNGYEIYIKKGENGKFRKYKTIKSGKKSTYKISKLKKNQWYGFKIRSFKIDKKGKKIYSKFSDIGLIYFPI